MQMPNASPQGIAGLMQQRPQPPQMPTPGKASPMAGLGSVDDRVSAYQGNTKPLEQRYAMSQDLLDLLALQKIKSQKDAAARQMQLQMAQQGAQDGQANMTVAQQREQEVNELTKNELAQQRGDTAQKQTSDQQAMMQKMMGGIARAPGANAAAQPQAMAAGGIVGYAGPEGSQVQDPVQSAKERAAQALAKLRTYGLRQRQQDPEGYAAAEQESRQAQEAVAAAERAITGGAAGAMRRPMGAPVPAVPAVAPIPFEMSPEDKAMRQAPFAAPAAPAAPAVVPKPPGLPSMPGAAGAPAMGQAPAPAAGPANDFGKKLEAAALKNAEIDPAARQLSEEQRVEKRLALKPEERKVYEEGISGLQKMYQEQYDPERQRQEGLKRFLIGAGGRRYGEFAGGAGTAMDYDTAQRNAKLKEFGDVQAARTGLIGLDRANVKGGIDAGIKAYEQSGTSQRQGLESGSRLYNTDVSSRDEALKLAVDRLKIAVQADATAAQREVLSQDRARTIYGLQLDRVEKLERNLDKDFAAGPLGMLMMQDPEKLKPEDKNRLNIARLELEQKKTKIRKEMEPILADARRKLGVTDSNLSAEDRAAIEKYTKGK
jgi:hypothetical protein